jgi:ABC-type amino acid transport substrate-binding protein
MAAPVGPVFRHERYGIALPSGSPLRKPINAALLAMQEAASAAAAQRR